MLTTRHVIRQFMPTRFVLLTVPWLLGLVVAVVLAGCGGDEPSEETATASVPAPTTVEVPITVQGATNLGSLQLALRFDPEVLEIVDVEPGSLTRNALVELNQDTAGVVKIGLVDTSGISGDGDVILLTVRPTGKAGTSPLTLEQVEASDTDLLELVVSVSPGQFGAGGGQVRGPALNFDR